MHHCSTCSLISTTIYRPHYPGTNKAIGSACFRPPVRPFAFTLSSESTDLSTLVFVHAWFMALDRLQLKVEVLGLGLWL